MTTTTTTKSAKGNGKGPRVDFFTAPETKPGTDTAAAPVPATPGVHFQLLPLDQVDPAPWNPRQIKKPDADRELAVSVKEQGVQQPIKVRPRPGGRFEVVFGSRRYRAAQAANLPAIPAMVEELTDAAVLELQAVENGQREDVAALEEAECYRRLRDLHHLTPEEIGARVSRGRTWVYDRLKLCSLAGTARTACLEGELDASVALLFARLPKALQDQALVELRQEERQEQRPLSYREIREWLTKEYQCDLTAAPFAVADAQLLPAAGPCTTCPKRSGNNRDDYPEAECKSPQICTDLACYRAKVAAYATRRETEHLQAGGEILQGKAAAKLFNKYQPTQLAYDAGYAELDSKVYVGNASTPRAVRDVVGKDAPVVLARDQEGRLHELVDRKLVDKAKRASERATATAADAKAAARAKAENAQQVAESERREREAAFERRLVGELGARVASASGKAKTLPEAAWRPLLLRVLEMFEDTGPVAARRGLLPKDHDPDDFGAGAAELEEAAEKGDAALLRALLFELLVIDCGNRHGGMGTPQRKQLEDLCGAFGVEVKAVRKEVAAAVQAENREAKLQAALKAQGLELPGKKASEPAKPTAKKGRR